MRLVLRHFALLGLGALCAPLASTATSGCALIEGCPDPIIHEVSVGRYALDRSAPGTQIGADVDYELTLSADGTTAVETFVRDGHRYRNEYAARPPRKYTLMTSHDQGSD